MLSSLKNTWFVFIQDTYVSANYIVVTFKKTNYIVGIVHLIPLL